MWISLISLPPVASNRHAARHADATTTMAIIAALTEIRHCFPWSWSERCNNGRTTKADSSNRRGKPKWMRGGGEEGECEKNLSRARETEAGWRKITREANVR